MNDSHRLSFLLSNLRRLLSDFEMRPMETTKAALAEAIHGFQSTALSGLISPPRIALREIEPTRGPRTRQEWLELQLEEVLTRFIVKPDCSQRLQAILDLMDQYLEEIQRGRTSPEPAPTTFHCKPIRPTQPNPYRNYFAMNKSEGG